VRNEIRYAIRGLLRDRVFALMIVLSLAVGIGANTATTLPPTLCNRHGDRDFGREFELVVRVIDAQINQFFQHRTLRFEVVGLIRSFGDLAAGIFNLPQRRHVQDAARAAQISLDLADPLHVIEDLGVAFVFCHRAQNHHFLDSLDPATDLREFLFELCRSAFGR
jgi:hypothetical protein